MVSPTGFFGLLQADWGWVVLFIYVSYQFYWPAWDTKFQAFHDDFATRLRNIEVTQIALAEEVVEIDEERVASLHDRDEFDPSDLKQDA